MADPHALICRAPHPKRDVPRYALREYHGAHSGRFALPLIPTGRLIPGRAADGSIIPAEEIDFHPLRAYAWCSTCGVHTEYRVDWARLDDVLGKVA